MKFTIRDLLLLTVIVALVAGWWVERRGYDARVKEATDNALKEADAYKVLSETLTAELRDENPTAAIEIRVNGREATISRQYSSVP